MTDARADCKKSLPDVAPKNCAPCKHPRYCPRDRHAADWKEHKKLCEASLQSVPSSTTQC